MWYLADFHILPHSCQFPETPCNWS